MIMRIIIPGYPQTGNEEVKKDYSITSNGEKKAFVLQTGRKKKKKKKEKRHTQLARAYYS